MIYMKLILAKTDFNTYNMLSKICLFIMSNHTVNMTKKFIVLV